MNKLFKNTYLTMLFAVVLTFSINAQTDVKQGILPDLVAETEQSDEPEKADDKNPVEISKLIPIKEGTTLRKIDLPKETSKIDRPNFPIPKQTQSYVFPTKKERFKLYLNRTIGTGLIGVTASSIVQQATEAPPEWEQNGKGFARRFGANLGTQAISETISYGLEESLKLDSKFYKSKKKDFNSRVKNAFLSSFTARQSSGKRVFNPSRIGGRYSAEIIATEAFYPERYTYKDGVRNATKGIGFNIGFNFLREFIFPD